MKASNSLNSSCRHCRFYVPEGRRGGTCQQLDVPVQSCWKACSLSLPPFAPSWEAMEREQFWGDEVLVLQEIIQSVQGEAQVESHPELAESMAEPQFAEVVCNMQSTL
ncbi:MAG: hypothetical protein SFW36_07010 [Leptolyngbyaceae cyanobacterium bins.59]|nr:hypothetical protein [Leptolyngbyaceae cyanobacterium bins.59]